ncbi:serine/threonine protein phosphatase [Toxoplasma gondii p89]|nr:serine/threonine protein phosphatase [Toxoplasma gondii p89]KFG46353.1 serine/threonine protein phosphatase [Toxoplasma gondii FOU]
MDLNNEGMVEYEEFLDSFSPVDTFFLQPGGEDEPSKTSNGPQNGKETLEETDASPTDNEVASNSRRFTLSSTLSQSA